MTNNPQSLTDPTGQFAGLANFLAPVKGKGSYDPRSTLVGVEPPQTESFKGYYGDWTIDQVSTNAQGARRIYKSNVKITFAPHKDRVCCDQIEFLQTARVVYRGAPFTDPNPSEGFRPSKTHTPWQWAIDPEPDSGNPWPGRGDPHFEHDPKVLQIGSSPSPYRTAWIKDTPKWNIPGLRYWFETCAVCRKGPASDLHKAYGCVHWGFDVD